MRLAGPVRNVIALTTILLAIACGSSTTSTATKPSPSPSPSHAPQIASVDACKLVTAEEASAAAGTTLTNESTSTGASTQGFCFYAAAGSSAGVIVFAQVYPDATAAEAVSPQQIAAALNGSGVANAKPVSGIGDKAVEYSLSSSGSTGIAIFVFKSNVLVMIAITGTSNASAVEQLARTAVGRL